LLDCFGRLKRFVRFVRRDVGGDKPKVIVRATRTIEPLQPS